VLIFDGSLLNKHWGTFSPQLSLCIVLDTLFFPQSGPGISAGRQKMASCPNTAGLRVQRPTIARPLTTAS
jgi:hypothetical protein